MAAPLVVREYARLLKERNLSLLTMLQAKCPETSGASFTQLYVGIQAMPARSGQERYWTLLSLLAHRVEDPTLIGKVNLSYRSRLEELKKLIPKEYALAI